MAKDCQQARKGNFMHIFLPVCLLIFNAYWHTMKETAYLSS